MREVEAINIQELKEGNEIQVFLGPNPDDLPEEPTYKMVVTGRHRNSCLVEVISREVRLVASLRGGMRSLVSPSVIAAYEAGNLDYPLGPTPGVLRTSTSTEDHCLYLQEVRSRTGEHVAKNKRPHYPIRRLVVNY